MRWRSVAAADETLWLSQALIAELFQVTVPTVNEHLKNLYEEGELAPQPTIRRFRIVRREGSRAVGRDIEHMGLTTWTGDVVRKADVTVAKNYLNEAEIRELNRIVTMWLDFAEDQARRRKQVFLRDWEAKLNEFLRFNERAVLGDKGRMSKEVADARAEAEYAEFAARRRAMLEAEAERDAQTALEDATRKLLEKPRRKKAKR
jgi:hypothetical protein